MYSISLIKKKPDEYDPIKIFIAFFLLIIKVFKGWYKITINKNI